MRTILKLSALLAVIGLGACSPYLYKSEIEAFGETATALTTTTAAQSEWEATQRIGRVQNYARRVFRAAQREGVALPAPFPSNECTVLLAPQARDMSFEQIDTAIGDGSTEDQMANLSGLLGGCHIEFKAATNSPERPRPLEYEISQAEAVFAYQSPHEFLIPIISLVENYAISLGTLANASDRDRLVKAQGQLSASVGRIVAEVGHSSEAADRSALATAITNTVSLGLRYQLDQRRLTAMRQSALVAESSLPALLLPIEVYLNAVWHDRMNAEHRALNHTVTDALRQIEECNMAAQDRPCQMSEQAYANLIVGVDRRVLAYRELSVINPNKAVGRLRTAHTNLANALRSPQRQLASALTAAAEFATAANELQTALQAFQPSEEENNDDQS